MNIEDIIRAWKADEDVSATEAPKNPIGEELSEADLREIVGGMLCTGPFSDCRGSCATGDTAG
jgi:mersacidin/lichenicidin family type 2 lantibiotic